MIELETRHIRAEEEMNELIECACGCGQTLLKYNRWGNPRRYIHPHNNRGKSNPNWKGGKTLSTHGYVLIQWFTS